MESYAIPLRALAEQTGWFVRATEARVLHVLTTHDLREAALEVVMAQEFHADNRSPFVLLDAPHTAAAPGWAARAESLRAQHQARRTAMKTEGYALPPLPPLPKSAQEPVALFAAQVLQLALARCPPLEGLVVVVAPQQVEQPVPWSEELLHVMETASLKDVRWVVVDSDQNTLAPVLKRLGDRAQHVECRVDERAAQRELGQRIDAAAAAGP